MAHRSLVLVSAVAAAVLAAACERDPAEDIAKERRVAQEEIARIQREADQKIADARREAEQKKAEATQDVAKERLELEAAIKNAKQDTREGYIDYARKRARLAELQAAEARAKEATLAPQARSDFDKKLRELEAKQRALHGTLNEADKQDPKQNWDTTKAKIQKDLTDLEKQLDVIVE